jgi:hypothetical protein
MQGLFLLIILILLLIGYISRLDGAPEFFWEHEVPPGDLPV